MKKRISAYLTIFTLIGLLLAIFMSYTRMYHTDIAQITSSPNILSAVNSNAAPKILTYFDDSFSVKLLSVASTVSVLLALLLPAFTVKSCDLTSESKNSIFTVFASSLLGFLFAGYFVNFLLVPIRHLWTSVKFPSPDIASMTPVLKLIYYAGIVVAIPCAVYFLVIATQAKFKPDSKMCVLSVFPVIWLSLRLIFYFMSTSSHVNVSGRKMYILSLALAVVFFLQDAKRWIPDKKLSAKESSLRLAIYAATGFASVLTFMTYHLSNTFLQAFWIIDAEDSYILNGIFIAMILFIAFRLASLKYSGENE